MRKRYDRYQIGINTESTPMTAVILDTRSDWEAIAHLEAENLASLSELLDNHVRQHSTVVVGVPNSTCQHHQCQIDDKLTPIEITEFIELHCPEWFGESYLWLALDYETTPTSPNQQQLDVYAVGKTYIESLLNDCTAHKLELIAVDINSHALKRLHQQPSPPAIAEDFHIAYGLALWIGNDD